MEKAIGTSIFLGLGSSLGDREANLRNAVERLQVQEVTLIRCSSLYESPHLGLEPEDQFRYPPHLNCVLEMETTLEPTELLLHLQRVEDAGGRERGVRWSPRTIDIDILLFGERVLKTDVLEIPHPAIAERAFVALPLRDLLPECLLQHGLTVAEVAESEPIRNQNIRCFKRDWY